MNLVDWSRFFARSSAGVARTWELYVQAVAFSYSGGALSSALGAPWSFRVECAARPNGEPSAENPAKVQAELHYGDKIVQTLVFSLKDGYGAGGEDFIRGGSDLLERWADSFVRTASTLPPSQRSP
jgi:hypothetical protein